MKRSLPIIFIIVPIVYVAVVLFFTSAERSGETCSGIAVSVNNVKQTELLDESGLLFVIERKFGKFEGRKISEICTDSIVKFVKAMPAVRDAGAYISQTGVLHVNAYQRTPLFRVFPAGGGSFAVDRDGSIIPVSGNVAFRSVVVTGNVTRQSAAGDLLDFILMLDGDALWRAMFEQIHIEMSGDVLLVPKVGDFKIRMGDLSDTKNKMENFRLFLKQGIEKKGWGAYKEINLKYRNQIIGVKK